MKKIVLISLLTYLLLPVSLLAQTQVEIGFELQEILKIAEMYKNTPNLSFTIDYKYSDNAHPDSALEHLIGYSKISDGRYYSWLDSSEYVQGYQYNVAIFHKDSAVVVNDRQEYADLTKLPILDSVFNAAYVDSMKIYSASDSVNTLHLYLSPSAPYSGYLLSYDKTNYRILNIQFNIKNVPTDEGVSSGTALIKIAMSAYSTAAIQQDTFWEDKFIYKQSGEIHLKPAYATYQLLDNTRIKTTLPQ